MAGANKFTAAEQKEIITMIGKGFSRGEINEYALAHFKKTISNPLLWQYRHSPKWIPVIKKIREKYMIDIHEAPLFHKRVRLERAEKIYEKAEAKGDLKNAISSLELARKETDEKVEGSSVHLTLNQINLMTDEEIEFRRQDILKRLGDSKTIDVKKES